MIYTSYEMIRDCREGRSAGWTYFVANFVPVMRNLLRHYFPERAADVQLVDRVLLRFHRGESALFQSIEPVPERNFVAGLRQHLLQAVEQDRASATPDIALDLETLAAALEPLTMVEKQAVWMETMRYDPAASGRILHIHPKTVEKNRERAAELVRGKVDSWRRSLLADNGPELGRAAASSATADCLTVGTFFDATDGRITWQNRDAMEAHVAKCLHCVDHFCRLLEVIDLLRVPQPLSPQEAARYRELLGLEEPKSGLWKRMFAR